MLLEAILLSVGAVATAAAGIPIAVRLARAQLPGFATTSAGSQMTSRQAQVTAAFVPLDLGEDPTQWPSAHPWPSSKLPVPDWPSKLWDDEHFGRHWDKIADGPEPGRARKDASPEPRAPQAPSQPRRPRKNSPGASRAKGNAAQTQRAESDRRRAEEQLAAQQREAAKQAAQQRQAATQAAQQREAATQAAQQRQAATQAERQREAAKQALEQRQRTRQAPASPAPQVQAPSRDELMSMVDSIGLAGTVQEIMRRTGWDFRQAAQYLAKVRSGG